MQDLGDLRYHLTSFNGRISRTAFWLSTIILFVIVFLIGMLLVSAVPRGGLQFRLIILVFQLVVLYFWAALLVKRLHDRNRPSYWAAFLLVPLVINNITDALGITDGAPDQDALGLLLSLVIGVVLIWFIIELGFLRGTRGVNQYGPDPLSELGDQSGELGTRR